MNREELFEKHLRGELDAAEVLELKHLLASDRETGRAFVEHANETALLVRVGSQLQSARSASNVVPLFSFEEASSENLKISEGPQEQPPASRRLFRFSRRAALAACLVALALVAITLVFSTRPPAARHAAEVFVTGAGLEVTRNGLLVKGDVIELQAGDVIQTPTNNIAVIGYQHEATRLQIQPGSIVVFGDPTAGKQFELRRGILHARVAPQPEGRAMSVQTAHARATVLGTEFVLRAEERATKLDVLEGKVEFACRASGRKVKVKAGFSATMVPKSSVAVAPLCSSNCILRARLGVRPAPDFKQPKTNP